MSERYVIRPDETGLTVLDLVEGRPARLATLLQMGLSAQDAEHTAALLNAHHLVLNAAKVSDHPR